MDDALEQPASRLERLARERRLGETGLGDDLRKLLGGRDGDIPERLERRRVDGDELAARDVGANAHDRIVAPAR